MNESISNETKMRQKIVSILVGMFMVSTVLPVSVAMDNVLIKVIDERFDIQGAIDNASDGDVIVVPDGVYPGGIIIAGGITITVMSENGPSNCIIDGNDTIFGFALSENEEGEPCDSILQGFTITNCKQRVEWAEGRGGAGIYCGRNCSPTVINCIIKDNVVQEECEWAVVGGGGVFCDDYSSPTFISCIITGNVVQGENESSIGGGGVFCDRYSSPTFISCEITDNLAFGGMNNYAYGGGVLGVYASPLLMSCLIANNTAAFAGGSGGHACGGGMAFRHGCYPVLKSCMVVENIAYTSGGGMFMCYGGPNVTLEGCTFSGNEAGGSGGAICSFSSPINIRNTILWGDYPQEIYLCGEYGDGRLLIDINFSDIQNGEKGIEIDAWYPGILNYGTMNMEYDPCFKDHEEDDFHIQIISPCVDAGDPDLDLSDWEYDFDMEPREYDILWITIPSRGPVDIGADEFVEDPIKTSIIIGKITNLKTGTGGRITFNAEKIRCIQISPFQFIQYTSNEEIMVLDNYFGILYPNFIFGFFKAVI